MSALENNVVDILTPSEFFLSQNSPNPFRERTTIKFCVAYKTRVRLEILNSDGELIKVLIDEEKEAGTYEVEFKCHSGEGRNLPAGRQGLISGEYFYQLKAGEFIQTKKMLLLK